jgi:hypothetical protein
MLWDYCCQRAPYTDGGPFSFARRCPTSAPSEPVDPGRGHEARCDVQPEYADLPKDHPYWRAKEEIFQNAFDGEWEAHDALFETMPTTVAGAAALLECFEFGRPPLAAAAKSAAAPIPVFSDGAPAVAARRSSKPALPTETDLQARLAPPARGCGRSSC